MSNTENKKTGVRFNFFDVLLILAVVSCIAGLVLHAYFTEDLSKTYSQEAQITLTVTDISENTAIALCRKDTSVYFEENDALIGTVTWSTYAPMNVELERADGTLVNALHPHKKTAVLTTIMSGTWTDDGFLITGNTLATVGKTLKIYTQDAVCTVTITEVIIITEVIK